MNFGFKKIYVQTMYIVADEIIVIFLITRQTNDVNASEISKLNMKYPYFRQKFIDVICLFIYFYLLFNLFNYYGLSIIIIWIQRCIFGERCVLFSGF